MPNPLALGLLALSGFHCGEEVAQKKPRGVSGTIDIPEPSRGPSPTAAPLPARSEYVPPQKASLPPQAQPYGLFYHPRFQDDHGEIRKSFPVGLQCVKGENRCYFALGASVYSFGMEKVAGETALPVEEEARLTPEMDEQTAQITSLLYLDGNFYALFDSFAGGLDQGNPKAGIAIRDNAGNALETFYFPDQEGKPVSCPKDLLYHPNTFEGREEIWVAAANCEGTDDFRDGNIFILSKRTNGTLEATLPPLTTTQKNPQDLAGFNANERAYVLAVNTGHTAHTIPGPGLDDRIVSAGGVDVIDAQTRRIVANVPLGMTAANTITISEDNTIAFVGSQIRPQVYALDLEWLATKLGSAARTDSVETWEDVAIADEANAIPLNWVPNGFYPEMTHHRQAQTLWVSSFNDGGLYGIYVPAVAHPGVGIELGEGFGTALRNFPCAGEGSENCGEVEWFPGGLLAMTGHPAGLTFIPEEKLVDR